MPNTINNANIQRRPFDPLNGKKQINVSKQVSLVCLGANMITLDCSEQELYFNMNWRNVQRKNVVAPRQNGPYNIYTHTHADTHAHGHARTYARTHGRKHTHRKEKRKKCAFTLFKT